MKKYECTSCKREAVVRHIATTLELKCCKGETPVKFVEVATKTIVTVPTLPKVMTDKKPLPLSTPAPESAPQSASGSVIVTK